MENIYDVIAWGRVVVHGEEFYLLSPKPYHSEMADGKVGHSTWQPEGTLKWEVASLDSVKLRNFDADFVGNAAGDFRGVYTRSIIIFGSDALIEFYQDPSTIKVKYVTIEDDDIDVAVAPTN